MTFRISPRPAKLHIPKHAHTNRAAISGRSIDMAKHRPVTTDTIGKVLLYHGRRPAIRRGKTRRARHGVYDAACARQISTLYSTPARLEKMGKIEHKGQRADRVPVNIMMR